MTMDDLNAELTRIAPQGFPAAELASIKDLLSDYEKFVYWNRDEGAAEIRVRLQGYGWLTGEILDRARERGAAKRKERASFASALRQNGPESTRAKEEYARLTRQYPEMAADLNRDRKHQETLQEKLKLEEERSRAGLPLSTVRAAGEHRIQNLRPAASWTLLIDETGSRFAARAKGTTGRFVGVLIPGEVALPPLAGSFHAVDAVDPAQIDAALQSLLDNPVGIFGITVDDLPPTPGDRWVDGVMEVIHWAWRLLPLDADTCSAHLDVKIEQRGEFDPDYSWLAVKRVLLRQWAALDPVRANAISIEIATVPKWEKLAGYVDAVAFTWGSSMKSSGARLSQSGLVGKCLNVGNGKTLRRLWDALNRNVPIAAEEWRWLLSLPESVDPESIAGALLGTIGAGARSNAPLWRTYLQAVQDHLESKAVNLAALGKECGWLNAHQPAETSLPPRLQLAWKTSLLAHRNHLGHTALSQLEQEIGSLSAKLLDEDARLVCLSDLHRSVLATNRFDFAEAGECLARWEKMPLAAAGLQMAGRVHSSFGQHLAFQGRLTEARIEFTKALDCFHRISDPTVVMAEKGQTETYLAIAIMDDEAIPAPDVAAAVERVTGKLDQSIPLLSRGNDDRDKYRHHLLLRYLAGRGSEEHKDLYLSRWGKWLTAEGHPWPLIAFYRGVLLLTQDSEAARKCFAHGFQLACAASQGSLVNLIGLAIQIAGHVGGQGWESAAEKALDDVEKQLPKAVERLRILRQAVHDPLPPLETMKKALPFNFR
jgi:hypothetical protein